MAEGSGVGTVETVEAVGTVETVESGEAVGKAEGNGRRGRFVTHAPGVYHERANGGNPVRDGRGRFRKPSGRRTRPHLGKGYTFAR